MGLFGKIKEGASKAAEFTKETVEISKLNTQISTKKREIDKIYNRMGELVFNAYLINDLPSAEQQVTTFCQEIVNNQQEIRQIEIKIKEAKNEKDCVCGKTVVLQAKFCAVCGHKFEEDVDSFI
jgi:hypothetical protein